MSALASAYFLLDIEGCDPKASLCRPLAILAVLIFMVPGIVVLGAGIISYSTKQSTFWQVQAAMVVLVGLYYVSFIAYLSLVSQPT